MRRLGLVAAVLVVLVACGGDDADAFCDDSRSLDTRMNALATSLSGDELPTADELQDAADAVEEVADDAPDEIEDDLRTIVDGIRRVADVIDGVDLSDPAVLSSPEFRSAAEGIRDIGPELTAAKARVGRYLQDECGIDDGGDGRTTGDGS
jgi:hypothetical protein